MLCARGTVESGPSLVVYIFWNRYLFDNKTAIFAQNFRKR